MPAKNRFDYFSDCILLKALFDLKLIYQINERFETRSVLELTRKLSVDTGNFLNEHFEVDFRGYTRCLERLYERRRKLKSWGRVPNNSAGTWLRKRLGISDEAYALYLLFATVSENSGFEALLDTEGNLSTTQFVAICSSLLSIAADDLRQELTSDSVLIRTGLVDLMTERASFSNKFIIRSCISSMLLSPDSTRHDLLEHLLIRAAKSNLVLADFEHLNTDLKAIVPFLRKAVETEMAGCNILLYGSP